MMEKKADLKLTVPEIIDYMKNDLGITFTITSEADAAEFLRTHNYFFRIKQYADNFEIKPKTGKYTGLDFGHLQELSTIDMYLRKLLLKMTIDVEHYLKVKIVNDCQENPADDGYKAVTSFLEKHPEVKSQILAGARAPGYDADIFRAHAESPAVWNIVEMIGFYDFINFFEYYYTYFNIMNDEIKHFSSVRRIRNAAAHNLCMLRSLRPEPAFKFDMDTCFELTQSRCGLTPTEISHNMKIPVLNDFAVMLDVYTKMVSSPKVKEMTFKEMTDFFDGRMIRRKELFENNENITGAYKFARKILGFFAA
jgi:abortive infection bacteriophage resistance protein